MSKISDAIRWLAGLEFNQARVKIMAKLSLRGATGVAGGKSKAKAKSGGRRNNAAQKAGYMKALQLYGYAMVHGLGKGGGESGGGESAPGTDFDFGANRF